MINIETIMKLLPHSYPFLLVDKVVSYKKGVIECRKNITINEPYFQGHFPKQPVVPGVLMIEMAAQSAGLLCILDYIGLEEIDKIVNNKSIGKTQNKRKKNMNKNSGKKIKNGRIKKDLSIEN